MFLRQTFLFPNLTHGRKELFLGRSHLPNEGLVASFCK
jgi:hypothetical protein